ncbi:thiolase domain-containing protein [Sciscionella marina]|uniref:thiolase domain-containing protein n=1 Tax=Sciscionella marina TaxID=508770 RepID=UPI0003620A86|nr:thiolase domain-containing protein [Sciscionella marina]
MTDVAVVGYASSPSVRETQGTTNGVEMLVPLFSEVFAETGLRKSEVGFWCSGSSDYLAGRAFSFIAAVDAIGAVPPINESHVEMDAAWAAFEAMVAIRTGEVDTAVVYGFGKSSAGELRKILALQLDPYTLAPLWPDSVSVAALQARAGIDAGAWTEQQMAEVVAASRRKARANPRSQLSGEYTAEELLAQPRFADPLRRHDCAPVTDGAAVLVLAGAERAEDLCERPAWIGGMSHRVETPHLGERDLSTSVSTKAAAADLDIGGVRLAELHAPFSHQEILLRQAIGLDEAVEVNPSGGPLAGNPMFAAGLSRIGEAASRIHDGSADAALAHATSGPALQQNLLCVLRGER